MLIQYSGSCFFFFFNYDPFEKGRTKGEFQVDIRISYKVKYVSEDKLVKHFVQEEKERYFSSQSVSVLICSEMLNSHTFWPGNSPPQSVNILAQSYYVNHISHIGTFNFVAIGGGNQKK